MAASAWLERKGWRAYLFVPVSRLRKVSEPDTRRLGPLVLDIEDGVPASEKEHARAAIAARLQNGPFVYLRINGSSTPWFRDDLSLLASDYLLGVVLPKAESARDVNAVREACRPHTSIIPLIETAAGLTRVDELANCDGVERLAFGTIDFRLDMRLGDGPLELLFARSQLVIASRAAGLLAPLDGTETELRDERRLAARARTSHRLGFGGKLCINPLQASVTRREFTPSESAIRWAREVLSSHDGAPVAVRGHMVDAPVRARARTILDEATWAWAPPS
jgi:citrate lyase subunit beta/citryl-CoA lyase